MIDPEKMMTVKELAKYLNVSVARVRHEIHIKRIPYYKLGASIRFSKKEIDQWLIKMRVNY